MCPGAPGQDFWPAEPTLAHRGETAVWLKVRYPHRTSKDSDARALVSRAVETTSEFIATRRQRGFLSCPSKRAASPFHSSPMRAIQLRRFWLLDRSVSPFSRFFRPFSSTPTSVRCRIVVFAAFAISTTRSPRLVVHKSPSFAFEQVSVCRSFASCIFRENGPSMKKKSCGLSSLSSLMADIVHHPITTLPKSIHEADG
jgi:hypothetical protein